MAITINGTTGIAGVDGSASTPAVQGTDTNTGIFFGTDTVTIATGGTTAVTVDSGQRTKFPTTIGVGGATPATSGSGITFPATASASSDANTLDDYEEGTWTPTVGGQTTDPSSVAYTAQTGHYTKIGNVVCVFGKLGTSSITGGSGFAIIKNLPFTSRDVSGGAGVFAYTSHITFGAGFTQLGLQSLQNTTTIRIAKQGTGIGGYPADIGDLNAGGNFDAEFQITYQV